MQTMDQAQGTNQSCADPARRARLLPSDLRFRENASVLLESGVVRMRPSGTPPTQMFVRGRLFAHTCPQFTNAVR